MRRTRSGLPTRNFLSDLTPFQGLKRLGVINERYAIGHENIDDVGNVPLRQGRA